MIRLYVSHNQLDFFIDNGNYSIQVIGSNQENGDLLYAIDGFHKDFENDYPQALDYYEGDWFLNFYPNSPGDTPLEKYLNAINGVTEMNPPKWNAVMPAIAQSIIFNKLLSTTDSNSFSALQTVFNYRNMGLFKSLAKKVILAIPGGLSDSEIEELNKILIDCNFPSVEEIMS